MFTALSTLLLGIVFVVLTFATFLVFKKLKIKIDANLAKGIAAWVLLAAFVRVFEDAAIYPDTIFTKTPGIIVLFFFIILPVLLLASWLEKKKKFPVWQTLRISAIIGILIHLPFYRLQNVRGLLLVFIISAIIIGLMEIFNKFIKADRLSFWAVGAHFMDAAATFVSMYYFNYGEQHILPNFLIDLAGPWVMFPLKAITIIPVVWILNRYVKEKPLRNHLLIAVMAIGLAPALRDALRLAMGV